MIVGGFAYRVVHLDNAYPKRNGLLRWILLGNSEMNGQ